MGKKDTRRIEGFLLSCSAGDAMADGDSCRQWYQAKPFVRGIEAQLSCDY